ncbi:MAG: hypothetical protein AB7M93_30695 [Candidatus Obscuribacterales bacterium]
MSKTQLQLVSPSDLTTDEIEIFDQANVSVPQLIWAEVNLLALPFAVIDTAKAKKTKGIHLEKIEEKDGKHIGIAWSVWPSPKYGMPTMMSVRVLIVLMHLATERKSELGYVPERLYIGSLSDICRRLGLPADGYSRKKIKEHIKTLVATTCMSQGAFKDKRREGLNIESFSYLRAAGFYGETDENQETIEQNYVVFHEVVRKNLNDKYIKQIDLTLMQEIDSPIGQLLYTKLSYLFNETMAPGQQSVTVQYHWLAQCMGVVVYDEIRMARRQLKKAIAELVDLHYIEEPVWNGFAISFTPGIRYTYGEHLPKIERSKTGKKKATRSKTKPQVTQLSIPLSITEAKPGDKLKPLCHFYLERGFDEFVARQARRHNLTEKQLQDEIEIRRQEGSLD